MTSKKDQKTTKEILDSKKEAILNEEKNKCIRGEKDCFNCKILDCPEEI